MYKYNLVAVGGTFDHFHKGHKALLRTALRYGKQVIVGITTDIYIHNKKIKNGIDTFAKRKDALELFLKEIGEIKRVSIIGIDDIYGPTTQKGLALEALIVTKHSFSGANAINAKRQELGLSPLTIITSPLLYGNDGEVISSSRIRKGRINREGRTYCNPLWRSKTLLLTDALREKLKEPFGRLLDQDILSQVTELSRIITVGDVVTKFFNEHKILPNIAVVDFFVQRKKIYTNIQEIGFTGDEELMNATNPAGCLTVELFEAIKTVFGFLNSQKRFIIHINGEDDLAVLPLLLCAPLGFTIFYGQPGCGVVCVSVTEENKEKAYLLVSQFQIKS